MGNPRLSVVMMESHPLQSQTIKVQLLLAGGHHYTVYLRSDEPLMTTLVNAIAHQAQGSSANAVVLQIPIEQGHASLCFPSRNLIGLITEPPLILQPHDSSGSQPPSMQTVASNIVPSSFIQLDNFLSQAERQDLSNFVLQKQSSFVPSSNSANDLDYRRSLVLHSFPKFSALMIKRIKEAFQDVCKALKINFAISDVGSPDTSTRELTFVYYFYREPKAFLGGELVIYDSKIENNYYIKADSFQTVEPLNNSIVFFPSHYMHEVLPIQCPSQAFADSRFTINGWIRRASL
jgi:SM-20-related protein